MQNSKNKSNPKIKKRTKMSKIPSETNFDDLCKSSKRFTAVKRFSKEEDKALLDFYNEYKSGEYHGKNFYRDIGKKMNRSESSLFHRLKSRHKLYSYVVLPTESYTLESTSPVR